MCPAGREISAKAGEKAEVSLSSSVVFERMLAMTDQDDWEKLPKALDLLGPSIRRINERFQTDVGQQIDRAVADKNKARVIFEVLNLIRLSIRDLLHRSHENAEDRSSVLPDLKEAYGEYLLLDPYVQSADFEASKTFKKAFQRASQLAGARPQEFRSVCQGIDGALAELFTEPGSEAHV